MSKSHLPLEERFWRRVHKTRACWLWLGAVDKHGYGSFYDYARKHNQLAHRISYELKHGSVLSNVVLSHLCENPSCVRPSHLKPMSHGDNLRYSVAQRGNLHLPSVNRTDPQRLKKLKAANDTKLKAQLVPENRIWRYINKTETCWLWTGHTDHYGYARLTLNNHQLKLVVV
ncbi:MAG TPA: HNH endonuclease [Candidatus Tectomicrobia bacterium]